MDNENKKESGSGGLYGKINMSLRTADIIITVLVLALIVTVIIALNM